MCAKSLCVCSPASVPRSVSHAHANTREDMKQNGLGRFFLEPPRCVHIAQSTSARAAKRVTSVMQGTSDDIHSLFTANSTEHAPAERSAVVIPLRCFAATRPNVTSEQCAIRVNLKHVKDDLPAGKFLTWSAISSRNHKTRESKHYEKQKLEIFSKLQKTISP